MKSITNPLFFFLAFTSIPLIADTRAEDSTDFDAIVTACNNRTISNPADKTSICFTYVDGFIAGAETFDDMLVDHLRGDHDQQSGFLERAYKTRLGISRINETAHSSAPFCVSGEISHNSVVEKIMQTLPTTLQTREQLHATIVTQLTREFPCI